MSHYYAGIGSRQTPKEILDLMTEVASFLEERDFVLRSGAAPGADSAFQNGVKSRDMKEIYLPWIGFNGSDSLRTVVSKKAIEIGKKFHPAWDLLSVPAQRLIARDSYQILGSNLDKPSTFVVCWTPGGKLQGGTAQAIRIAREHSVTVFNMGKKRDLEHIQECMATDQVFAL